MSAGKYRTRRVATLGARAGLLSGAVGLALAACASGASSAGGSSAGGSSPLEIAVFSPFTGPNGHTATSSTPGASPPCTPINAAGGVMGHDLTCTIVDNRGEPADAVPAAKNMLANSSHLVGIVDGDSGLLSATVPASSRPGPRAGRVGRRRRQFDTNTYPYFWRTTPGDDQAGYTLAAYVKFDTGFTRVAAVFGNDAGRAGQRAGPRRPGPGTSA